MPAISREEVAHLAHLSRLALTDEELDEYSQQLEKILEHVAAVSDVATDDVPAMSHPTPIVNVQRDDVRVQGLTPAEALDQAPNSEGDRFQVPQILGEE
ncbi:Asp-tRNA(Asn)/Glu-tRNA(Gln) amidotransferase subunit GatC [Dietzia sp.]|uniref:Asp-tRNA(Asn)/Glu-tRNA(Gln) amidotransferase subunit GatC n=1 Tax=Dietzia sp. TaxID=1871616 RepID=UPI002FD8F822